MAKKNRNQVIDDNGDEVRLLQIRLSPAEWARLDRSWMGKNGLEETIEQMLRVGISTVSASTDLLNSKTPGQDAMAVIGNALITTVRKRVALKLPPKVQTGLNIATQVLNMLNPPQNKDD